MRPLQQSRPSSTQLAAEGIRRSRCVRMLRLPRTRGICISIKSSVESVAKSSCCKRTIGVQLLIPARRFLSFSCIVLPYTRKRNISPAPLSHDSTFPASSQLHTRCLSLFRVPLARRIHMKKIAELTTNMPSAVTTGLFSGASAAFTTVCTVD